MAGCGQASKWARTPKWQVCYPGQLEREHVQVRNALGKLQLRPGLQTTVGRMPGRV